MVVGATTSGAVLLNCPQPAHASMAIAAATHIGKSCAGFGPTLAHISGAISHLAGVLFQPERVAGGNASPARRHRPNPTSRRLSTAVPKAQARMEGRRDRNLPRP